MLARNIQEVISPTSPAMAMGINRGGPTPQRKLFATADVFAGFAQWVQRGNAERGLNSRRIPHAPQCGQRSRNRLQRMLRFFFNSDALEEIGKLRFR